MTKRQLIKKAQQYCDADFDEKGLYTPWSNMKTLIDKGLFVKSGRPLIYSLTEDGETLAKNMSKSVKVVLTIFIIDK